MPKEQKRERRKIEKIKRETQGPGENKIGKITMEGQKNVSFCS